MKLLPSRRIRLFLLPSLLLGATMGAAPDVDPLTLGEKAASEWIKVRLETTRVGDSWAADRPLLESTIRGLKDRAQGLEEKRDLLKAKTAKDREEIDSMVGKNKAASDDLRAADLRVQALVAQLVELRPSLPPRLSEALEMSYKSLGNQALPMGERMQLAMTVLSRCMIFDRTITSGEEVLSIDGESGAKSLEVIYWGLSHGYALDRAAGKAWYGSPGGRGWQWEASPEGAKPVARLIAIYNDKADPDFVTVPATLRQPLAESVNK